MKTLFISFFLFISVVAFGQQKEKSNSEWQPLFYLDSVQIEKTQLNFDPNKIADIRVENFQDSAKQINGKVFITSKDPKKYNFWTISEVTKAFCKDCTSPTIYMLDNEFLKDITRFKIDSSFILRVEFTKAREIEYLKNSIPDLTILKIITRTKANLDKQSEIRIRGIQPTATN